MKLFLPLIVILSNAPAESQPVLDCPSFPDRSVLQYDDGSAEWSALDVYKGVWFSLSDFSPYAVDFSCEQLEFWMNHGMGTSWWDSEIWIGGPSGPDSQLVSVFTSGIAGQATFVVFDPPILCGTDFWVIMDCSSGGQPLTYADGTPNPVIHSFVSSDGEAWEPFAPGSCPTAVDFWIRAHGSIELNLENTTWGSIKSLF